MTTTSKTITPEQKRRRLIRRKKIITVAMSSKAVQKQFLLKQRLVFLIGVLLGIAAMWITPFLPPQWLPILSMPLFVTAPMLWAVSIAVRLRSRRVQVGVFFLGFITLGTAVGTLATGPGQTAFLATPSILVGLPTLGALLTRLFSKKLPSPAIQFLISGVWFLIACLIVFFFFMINEVVFALSGVVSMFLVLLLHHSQQFAMVLYRPKEYVYATADVIGIAFNKAWRTWTGQNEL
jgi:FtsH-binding integral membrane protein